MSIEKGDATKYVHTGNGELCYELNKALTVPETFPIYLSSAYIFDSIDPIDKICDEGDYVLAADDRETLSSSDVLKARWQHHVGDTMTMTIWRDGEIFTVTLELKQAVQN